MDTKFILSNISGVLQKIVDGAVRALMAFACVVVAFLIVMTCVDVIGRYFLNRPLTGSTELTEMGLAVLVFTGLPVITYRQKHIVVDVFDTYIPKRTQFWIAQVSYAAIGFGFFTLAQYAAKLASRALRRGTLSEYLEIPQGYLMIYAQYSCYVSAGLMVVLIAQNFLCPKNPAKTPDKTP